MPPRVKRDVAAIVEDFAPEVEIRLSSRRTKTLSARREAGRIVVMAPAGMSAGALRESVESLVRRVEKRSSVVDRSDADLQRRAQRLNSRYLENRAVWTDIRWVTNMERRWGSCSPDTGRVRISHYLKDVPDYVLDQVIVHELVHTFIPNHSDEFYSWAHRIDQWERADGYLEAYQRWGRGMGQQQR
ncbi:M48 family metallopeptidase [Corynebacterium kroppenstedtii]|uniref:M48 metallopeptidase family protein n=1 Tax=Corynebacterium sp. PCR 32 TaxID=3351342 RepID=UPI0030950534